MSSLSSLIVEDARVRVRNVLVENKWIIFNPSVEAN